MDIPAILESASFETGVKKQDIISKSRKQKHVIPRLIVMYLGWQLTDLTLAEIGEQLGGRYPATISSGFQTIAKKKQTDNKLRYLVQAIEAGIGIL